MKKVNSFVLAVIATFVLCFTSYQTAWAETKTKEVCKEVKNKNGSTKNVCKKIKVHKKAKGTKVPDQTKKDNKKK